MVMPLRRILASSFGFWLALAVVALYFLYPPMQKLTFGIDLVGGTYITLGVQTNDAIAHELQSLMFSTAAGLKRDEKIEAKGNKLNKENLSFDMSFDSQENALKAEDFIREEYRNGKESSKDIEMSLVDTTLTVRFSKKKEVAIRQAALIGNKEVLQTRLNATGVEEVPVYTRGNDRIVVELPNVHDPIKAKKLIGTPAMLEFRIIEEGPFSSKEELLDKFDGELPEGMEILEGRDRQIGRAYFLVPDYSEVTGRYLLSAKPRLSQDRSGSMRMAVNFQFNSEGGKRFYELTSQNVGRLLGAILDKKVISHATIQEAIKNEGQISGNFSQEESKELATLLKSGSFTAPVTFEEERHIGPALGSDSIRHGLISCLVGLGLIFIFSLFYYKLSGLFAFIALVYNLILVLFILSRMHAALTLPGIAGLVLTVGMAIDSSILIYEKIKELLSEGMHVPQAVRHGFSDAMTVILDANITTFIVGIVLYHFGSGPIKGFAVTLMVGIITTLITGLFFLRSLFELLLTRHIQKLSI
jgi:preprotein translocase subunit SecD